MKKYEISLEKLEAIKNLFGEAVLELDKHDLCNDEVAFHDIMSNGANGIIWHIDMEFEELPESVVLALDNLHDEVWNSFDDVELKDEFIEEFLGEFYM